MVDKSTGSYLRASDNASPRPCSQVLCQAIPLKQLPRSNLAGIHRLNLGRCGAATALVTLLARHYSSQGRVRYVMPGRVSSRRKVPQDIPRPDYLLPDTSFDEYGFPAHPFQDVREIKKDATQITPMRRAGKLAREALAVAAAALTPGISTDEVDAQVHEFIISSGAYPSCLGYVGFPKCISTSVNDVIAHGIPDDRRLEDGDILNIDVTVYVDGHHGDTSATFFVGDVDDSAFRLCKAAERATMAGIAACGPGVEFNDMAARIEEVAEKADAHISGLFSGHFIGSYFHGAEVLPYATTEDQGIMEPGMTFTIEPILVENRDDTSFTWSDGWTTQTCTGARTAQFEHTVLITPNGHEILTGPTVHLPS